MDILKISRDLEKRIEEWDAASKEKRKESGHLTLGQLIVALEAIAAFLMVLLFIFGIGCLYGYFAGGEIANEIDIGTGLDALIIGIVTTVIGGIVVGVILFWSIAALVIAIQERLECRRKGCKMNIERRRERMLEIPQFKHDTDCCVFLGRWHCVDTRWHGNYDLYFCDQGIAPVTVLARFGNDGPEYTSSLAIALSGQCLPLAEAVKRVMELLDRNLVRSCLKSDATV